ncbi:MAG: hypothetical protein AAF547_18055 [Actinomycetota bacterium]
MDDKSAKSWSWAKAVAIGLGIVVFAAVVLLATRAWDARLQDSLQLSWFVAVTAIPTVAVIWLAAAVACWQDPIDVNVAGDKIDTDDAPPWYYFTERYPCYGPQLLLSIGAPLRHLHRPWERPWIFGRIEVEAYKWDFKDSWLTNLTAVGAVLATVLAATNTLADLGLTDDKGGGLITPYVLINIGAVGLAAAAPMIFAACRSYRTFEPVPKKQSIRIVAHRATSGTIEFEVPSLKNVVDRTGDKPTTTTTVEAPGGTNYRFDDSLTHDPLGTIVSVEIDEAWHQAGSSQTAEKPNAPLNRVIALDVLGTMSFSGPTMLIYDTPVFTYRADPAKKNAGKVVPIGAKEHKRMDQPSGTFFGFLLAGGLALFATLVQLGATLVLLNAAPVSSGGKAIGRVLLVTTAAFAMFYVFRTLSTHDFVAKAAEKRANAQENESGLRQPYKAVELNPSSSASSSTSSPVPEPKKHVPVKPTLVLPDLQAPGTPAANLQPAAVADLTIEILAAMQLNAQASAAGPQATTRVVVSF